MGIEVKVKTKKGATSVCYSEADAIKEMRTSVNLTQETLAGTVGISRKLCQLYEYGFRTPKESMLQAIAQVTGAEIEVTYTPSKR